MLPQEAAANAHRLPSPLRSIPAGYDIDRWPIHVPPRVDELPAAWISRVADRAGLNPRQALEPLGVKPGHAAATVLGTVLVPHVEMVAGLLGIDSEQLRQMLAPDRLNVVLRSYLHLYWPHYDPVKPVGCRFCPACLREPDPVWDRSWNVPLVTLGLRHEVLLVSECPRCGNAPWSTTSWLARATPTFRCPGRLPPLPSQSKRRHRPWCNHDLRNAPQTVASQETVAAQRLLVTLAKQITEDADGKVLACGVPVTPATALDALLELACENSSVHPDLVEIHPDPAALSHSLTLAARIVSAPTIERSAREATAAGLLRIAGPIAPAGPPSMIRARAHNPILATIRFSSLTPNLDATNRLTFRTAEDHPRYPLAVDAPQQTRLRLRLPSQHPDLPDLTTAAIPQVLWAGSSPPFELGTPHCRALAAMLLAKNGNLNPWRHITLDLGLPGSVGYQLSGLWRNLTRENNLHPTLKWVEELYTRLQMNQPPIDYQIRRIIGEDYGLLARAILGAAAGTQIAWAKHPAFMVRRFWELFTGGHICYARGPLGLRHDTAQYRAYRAWSIGADAEYGAVFSNAYELLKASGGLRIQGPLIWQPP